MQNLAKRLEKIGWEGHEIEKALRIISSTKAKAEFRFLEKRIYWILLIVIIAANFAVSVALLPALMALKGNFLYITIIVLGISFGLLFELVIRSIEHLQAKHHIALAIFIPAAALASFFAVSNSVNFRSPLAVSLAYAVSFTIPYAVCRFIFKIGYYSK